MTKDECKAALHNLFPMWARERSSDELDHPSFLDFKRWLGESGYSHYLNFRSVAGSYEDAEAWFDQYFKQAWRR